MASCLSPYQLKDGPQVPCGRCPPCIKRKVNHWAFRLRKELERSVSAHFVTLTYNTDFVPITPNGFMTLDKGDCQKFFKRLRRYHERNKIYENFPIRYYLVGEYGGDRDRPHYHIIIFNTTIPAIESAWSLGGSRCGKPHYGSVSAASIAYTLKYLHKQAKIGKYKHSRDDRVSEFSLMSRGLGSSYLTPEKIKWHNEHLEDRNFLQYEGYKMSMPRYYKGKIYSSENQEIISASSIVKSRQADEEFVKTLLKYHGDDWREKYLEYIRFEFIKQQKKAKDERKAF